MTLADVPAVAGTLARAFADDPLQVWVVPDAARRVVILEDIFAVLARVLSVPAGNAWTDVTCSCAAYWIAPGPPRPLTDADRTELAALDARLSDEVRQRLQTCDRALRAARPPGDYFYLQGIGTDPDMQGRGLGSAVLAPVLARLDLDAVPAYLESTKEKNIPFYERHGFRVTGLIQIPDDGPTLWAMGRDPVLPA